MKNDLIVINLDDFKYIGYVISNDSRKISEKIDFNNSNIVPILSYRLYSCNVYFAGFSKCIPAFIKLNINRYYNDNKLSMHILKRSKFIVTDCSRKYVLDLINKSLINKSEFNILDIYNVESMNINKKIKKKN